jgi:hypothetical protein
MSRNFENFINTHQYQCYKKTILSTFYQGCGSRIRSQPIFVNPDPDPNHIRIRIQTEYGSESRTESKPDPD